MQAPACANALQFSQYIVSASVASFVGGGANVQAEAAASRHHVDGAVGHVQHAHGTHQVRFGHGALFLVQREFGHGGGGICAAAHWGGAGVAGHAHHFAHVAHAAVDGGDHAQRQVLRVEHRALLDVRFHKAEVLGRVALQFGNVVNAQAGVFHGFAH